MTSPFPLGDPVLQRLFEDVYQKVQRGELSREAAIADLNSQLAALRDRITGVESSQRGVITGGRVLPVPENLTVSKIGFFGVASVTAFRLRDYPALRGYEFYGSATTGFTPDDDKESDGFNRLSHGLFPWTVFWCDLDTTEYFVRARTFGARDFSELTDEVSSMDVPDTPTNVTAEQLGNLYPVLGQLRGKVLVSWDHMTGEHIVGYDVETIDEGEW